MASIDRSDPIILGHVLAEHRELFCQMSAIHAALCGTAAPTRHDVERLVACVSGLREHLRGHFAQEEKGGFLEEAIARMPRLARAATAIMKQHPALLAELDALVLRLREMLAPGDISAAAWQQAARDYECFAAHMQAHERSENAVVQEGYNEDLDL
ncbi:MAG: hypothetical protein ACK48M_13725 [Planctomycetia bacterium]